MKLNDKILNELIEQVLNEKTVTFPQLQKIQTGKRLKVGELNQFLKMLGITANEQNRKAAAELYSADNAPIVTGKRDCLFI